ncbi:MAG: ATP-binding protein [Chthoniobacteraceae bacterium]
MIRRFFSTTLGQILAIIATSSALTFLLFVTVVNSLYTRTPPPPPWPWPPAYRIASLVNSLQVVPESDRASIIAAFKQPGISSINLIQTASASGVSNNDTRNLERVLKSELGSSISNVTVRIRESSPSAEIQVLIGLGHQTLEIDLNKILNPPRKYFSISFPAHAALLFLCIGVAAMSAWAIWRVIRPLRRLSLKVDAFGRDIAISPIEEEGPLEIRRVARTFNLMQQRITRSIQDRTRMLAAISHDLRTPLTRMRLQLETGQGELIRHKLLRDVGLMQSMVTSALAFLSGSFNKEEKEWVDLGALLSTLCDEFEERGAALSYEGRGQIRFFCRPNAITRALTNVVENAVHFGKHIVVTASAEGEATVIEVVDDGPGIPKDRVQDVVEPFVRLDPSRSNRPGSVGLGLSIVKEIVEGHGGTLELIGRQPTGLIARISIPKDKPSPPQAAGY